MNDRRRVLMGMAAAAVALPACADKTRSIAQSGDPVEIQLTSGGPSAGDSILPDLTAKARMRLADKSEEHASYAPSVPPPADRSDQRIFEVALEVVESIGTLDPTNNVTTEMWGFRLAGDNAVTAVSPGPVLRGRVGDVARITLTNLPGNKNPHNIDCHAITGQGGGAADLTVAPGDTASIEVRLLFPGVFMYHCAFGDVPMHIAKGMVGMFIVDTEEPLPPVDHEWAVMQSEWYVGAPDANGLAPFDPAALRLEEPRYVTFNGRTDALIDDNALEMKVGERSRIYMINEGLNLNSNFHAIGSQWDVVYPEAATHPANTPIRGSQSTLVVTGGGTIVELLGLVPSKVLLVDHALVRTFYKGALGHVVIAGDLDKELFEVGISASGLGPDEAPPEQAANAVTITKGAFDPANADQAYSPNSLTVPVGTIVTWTNEDAVFHTVTSGTSNGTTGTPDGIIESGEIQPGESFSYTFDTAGTFDYHCTPHPWMQGSVTVE